MVCTNKIIKIKKKTYKLIGLTGNAHPSSSPIIIIGIWEPKSKSHMSIAVYFKRWGSEKKQTYYTKEILSKFNIPILLLNNKSKFIYH